MKNLILISQKQKEINVTSEDIRNMIEGFDSVKDVKDFSNQMEEDVFGYYVTLESSFVEETLEEEAEDLSYGYDEDEIQAAIWEQAEYLCDALVDNLKEYIESRYQIEGFQSAYDLIKADLNEGIGFNLTLSFGTAIKHGKLYELASNISRKNSFLN